jgi:beta-glucosidase
LGGVSICILQRHPAKPRLRVPLFNWRDEANRGLLWPTPVTVWPTPLGIAASFNTELVEKAASDLGDEVRAMINRSVAKDPVNAMKDCGLCVWSPIVDLGRDRTLPFHRKFTPHEANEARSASDSAT